MTSRGPTDPAAEAFWRAFLTTGDPSEIAKRRLFNRLPRGPRCRMCAAPFSGLGGTAMRVIGRGPSDSNPTMCMFCFTFLQRQHGGAEIEATFLFADVRGSTALAERMSVAEYRTLIDRFYTTATEVVFRHDGFVDKFVGDELVAMYFPLLTGDAHPAQAVATALDLLRATGHEEARGPWVPLGAGVHTGNAWIGSVGEGGRSQVTALGDAVNTAARIGSAAAPGEILVSTESAPRAGLDVGLGRRSLELKGKQGTTEVVVLRVDAPA